MSKSVRKITSGAKRQDSVFFVTQNGIIMSAYCARTLAFNFEFNTENVADYYTRG